ncbi:MAG TPA: DivIVA domain-containing protein, partial [Clostridiales bacterium]|nr:DivIVA domain-containing protein [Clostridiales bacterium]
MLTPDKIKSQSFNLIDGQAYSKSEVDAFLEEVSRSYAQMFQENGELLRKISILATRIEEYRREEDIIKKSLAAAQRSAEKLMADARASISTTLDQARREASLIKIDAQNRAKEII